MKQRTLREVFSGEGQEEHDKEVKRLLKEAIREDNLKDKQRKPPLGK